MPHNIDFAELRKVRAITHKALIKREDIHIASGHGKSTSALSALFPKQGFIEY
jgi:hypothetical protein